MTILAQRLMRIRRHPEHPFGAITGFNQWYGVESLAACRPGAGLTTYNHSREGDSPNWRCECGFYAFPPDLLDRYTVDYMTPVTVRAEVELAGKIIEHKYGYRAEWMRVLKIWVDPCRFCGRSRRWWVQPPEWNSARQLAVAQCRCPQAYQTPGPESQTLEELLGSDFPVPVETIKTGALR